MEHQDFEDIGIIHGSPSSDNLKAFQTEYHAPIWSGEKRSGALPITQRRSSMFRCLLRAGNSAGIMYFLIVLSLLFTSAFFYFGPAIYDADELHFRRMYGLFMVFNIVMNYILIIVKAKDSVYTQKSTSALCGLPDQSWRFCAACSHDVPPRSHHCTLCNGCILKQDHHCFFTGVCIGFYNQRYFTMFCFYASVGTGYSLAVMVEYVHTVHFNLTGSNVTQLILPVVAVKTFMGSATWSYLGIVVLINLAFGTCLMTCYFWTWQLLMIYRGQTTYEFHRGNITFKNKPMANFRSVFGSFWFLNILAPMVCFQNRGNGIDWGEYKYV
ncbi:unnamed protein product [Owenia fusiformis]|uniref:Palmitoyltransferase n=1 Tax=Owenia fusiformis TaxID=6347 RepID=A0A8J1TR28_OWEFU|nr:unnamed protein product [Owenia fusiformis]